MPSTRRRSDHLVVVTAVGLLLQMAVAMTTTAVQQTPVIDEPVYAGSAVVQWQQHSLRYNAEHPPLGKTLMGAALAFASPRLDPGFAGDQTELGRRLLYESGNDPYRLMLLARLPMIALTLALGVVVLLFARDLFGSAGGLVALALFAFSPDLIAHGSLATLDVPAAGFLFVAVWAAWRARNRPVPWLAVTGLALGAALATRMSTLPAVPVVLLLVMLSMQAAARRLGRALLAALVVLAGAVAVVWLSYLVVDPRLRWTAPSDLPEIGGLRGLLTEWLPFPRPYRDGMLIQFGYEDRTWGGFLFGRSYEGSVPWYFPAALLVKTPLGTLALWLAGTGVLLAVRRLRPAAPYLLLTPAVLGLAAALGARNFGTRYVVVVPIFFAVVAAAVTVLRSRWVKVAVAALVAFVAVSSLRTSPYYLPYANEAFGGPAATARHLHDSNADWGQDLGRLAGRLRERYPEEPVWLSYKGSGVPAAYQISARDPLTVPPVEVRGLLVVSDSLAARADEALAALIADSTAIDRVGHTITIYRR
ncbi:MAG TPA: phospholipid carrier-dependent glycosyltransferase [Propionibacteriaceae bacterium]|nr:phospholipid carrier-dependent glycosyltransferase [Propionibacteriaceae bacterium]